MKAGGQVFIETSIAIIVLLLLLVFIARIFTWMNLRIIERHEAYEDSREDSSHPDNFYDMKNKKLRVFPQEE